MPAAASILVIEDDPAISAGVATCLELEGYGVLTARDFATGRRLAIGGEVDLVLLDLALPGGDGLDLLAGLRAARPARPVIILTARGAERDRVTGLRLGADDYVVKPFGTAELVARVGAVLRRAGPRLAPTAGRLRLPGGSIDLARREAVIAGEARSLGEQEARLIALLVERRERTAPREELLGLLWNAATPGLSSRAVDMLVARLRLKLGDPADSPRVIVTVRGCGYRLGPAVIVEAP